MTGILIVCETMFEPARAGDATIRACGRRGEMRPWPQTFWTTSTYESFGS